MRHLRNGFGLALVLFAVLCAATEAAAVPTFETVGVIQRVEPEIQLLVVDSTRYRISADLALHATDSHNVPAPLQPGQLVKMNGRLGADGAREVQHIEVLRTDGQSTQGQE